MDKADAVVALVLLVSWVALSNMAGAENWHENAFFGLHYDLHPNAGDTELGRETAYDHIREQLEKVKPDFVQYDCKGHPGYTGYPTEVGSPSPGIVNDALAVWREVTRDMGVPLSIHYSGVWDSRAVELHPEWARVDPAGNRHDRYTCPLSPYTDELMIPQLLEVVEKYDIDGMWIDGECWASLPCYCDRCRAEFTRRTGIEEIPTREGKAHWDRWLAFHRDLFVEHVTRYVEAVHAADPEVMVCSNWMYSVRMPEPIEAPVDSLSGDFSPSFGTARACAEARFIASRGMPWDLMAWTFLRTGGQGWTMKPAVHLCQELSEVLAQGGAVFLYNQPQRSGRLTSWHQDIFAEVAEFCRQRKEYCFKTETVPQAAVLHSETCYYRHNQPLFNFGGANTAMEGAVHALLENGYSVDILNEARLTKHITEYPLVVVPEQDGLPQDIVDLLDGYAQDGGRVFVTGAHVAAQMGELCGVKSADGRLGASYVPASGGCVIVGGHWQKVILDTAVEVAPLLDQQEPELNRAGFPAATINKVGAGAVLAVHGPVFDVYNAAHYPRLRCFIGDMVERLNPSGLIKVCGPWWVELSARKRDGKTLLQLVNRSSAGHLSPDRHVVEHVSETGPFTVYVPMEKLPGRCYLAPDKAGLDWSYRDGILEARVAGLGIHNVLVIE